MVRDSGTPGRPSITWAEDGWPDFLGAPGLTRHNALEDLGFLTVAGRHAVRDACGDDCDTLQLMVEVCARGPTWLPCEVFGLCADDLSPVAQRLHDGLWKKMRTMAGLP